MRQITFILTCFLWSALCSAQTDELPPYFRDSDYQRAVKAALTLQMQADSLQWLVEAITDSMDNVEPASRAPYRARIRDAAEMAWHSQKQAEQWHAKTADYVTRHQQTLVAAAETTNGANSADNDSNSPSRAPLANDFDILPHSPYSASNPFPTDEPLPAGVVYRIQLGAYSKPKPTNAFKGLTPIAAVKLSSGVTKYYVGQFRSNAAAEAALKRVKQYGFKDAFVAAFYNGKSILTNRAIELEKIVNK